MCYLCDEEPTAHAEHISPQIGGGDNRLLNLGGACMPCNLAKGDRAIDFDDDQERRLAEQQAAIGSALISIDVDVFWHRHMIGWVEETLEFAEEDFEDWGEGDLERDDIQFYTEQVTEPDREEWPLIPRGLEEQAIDEILRRLAQG
jgi:hypothetical protein